MTRLIGLTSGTGSFNFGPIYRNTGNTGLVNYSKHAYIYTSAELNIPAGSRIISLEWLKRDSGRVFGNNTFNVLMSNTSVASYTGPTLWGDLIAGATPVFASTTFSVQGGANTYQLATLNQSSPNDSFIYTGGNLQILCDWQKQGFATAGFQFYVQGATGKALGLASNVPITNGYQLINNLYGNSRPTLRITYVTSSACAGAPNPGNTLSTSPDVCPGSSFILNVQNSIPQTGVTYQWQSASDSNFTLNFSTLSSSSAFTTSQAVSTYYRCKVTCTSSGLFSYTTPLRVLMKPSYACYCQSQAIASSDEDIFKFELGNQRNCSDCITPAPGPGSAINLYGNYFPNTPFTLAKNSPTEFTLEIGTCVPGSYSNRSAIFIDLNQDRDFTDSGELVYSSPSAFSGAHSETGFIQIPSSALNGLTGLRIITVEQNTPITNPCLIYNWGETEDYLVNIVSPVITCSGMPNPGPTVINLSGSCTLISGSHAVCAGQSFTFSLMNSTPGSGVTYQWFQNGALIPGATNKTYTSNPFYSASSIYCNVTCQSGSSISTMSSTPLSITLAPFLQCYCRSYAVSTADEEILSFSFGSGTNSSSCVSTGGAGSILNQYSNFATSPPLDTVDLGSTVSFNIDVNDCDIPPAPYYSFGCSIWIDFNQNASFSDPGEQVYLEPSSIIGPRLINGTITIPCTAKPGITMLRVTAAENLGGPSLTPCLVYGFGETEDYLVRIVHPSNPCTLPIPSPLATISNISVICDSAKATLSLSNACVLENYSFQWFKNNVPISGATNNVYMTPMLTNTTTFSCQISCGGSSIVSTPVTITKSPAMNLSFTASSSSYCIPGGNPVVLTSTGAASYSYAPANSLSGSTGSSVTATPSTTTTYTLTATDANGCTKTSTLNIVVTNCAIFFSLKLFLQGYFLSNGSMKPVLNNQGVSMSNTLTDSIIVELRDPTPPYALVLIDTIDLFTNGVANMTFPSLNNPYYIVIKHRNTLQTWSAIPVSASAGSYDFSNAATKAYGNNMTEVEPGTWALYTGELNYDDNIDLLDDIVLSNAISDFLSGYQATDINGDGNVDLLDSIVPENNINNFIFTQKP